jgi:hypothetical protein
MGGSPLTPAKYRTVAPTHRADPLPVAVARNPIRHSIEATPLADSVRSGPSMPVTMRSTASDELGAVDSPHPAMTAAAKTASVRRHGFPNTGNAPAARRGGNGDVRRT